MSLSPDALDHYISTFESLAANNIQALNEVMSPEIHFQDPFSKVSSLDDVKRIFEKMFVRLPQAKFEILDSGVMAGRSDTAFLEWRMIGGTGHKRPPIEISGTSVVRFNSNGIAVSHVDHWDAASQFYERLPFIGFILKAIRKRI